MGKAKTQVIDKAQTAIFREDYDELRRLLKSNPALAKARDADGRTLVMLVALEEHANLEVIDLLIRSGCDIQCSDKGQSWTALHFAARDENTGLVELLLKRGAKVDPVDCFGNSPLWRAVMNYQGDPGAIEVLIRAGADQEKKNKSGISPRDLVRDIADPKLKNLFSSQ